jgi:hypothetical protein
MSILRDYLELGNEKPQKKDFYTYANNIYLGTTRPFNELPKNSEQYWYKIKMPKEFNWLLWSSAGTYKSKLLQTIIPYFYKQGYKIFIFEGKDATLSFNLNKVVESNRIYPEAYNIALPTISHLPSYLISSQYEDVDRIEKEIVKKFNKVVTLPTINIKNSIEWQGLLGASVGGADILNVANKQFKGNLYKIQEQIRKGWIKDQEGHTIQLHGTAKNSVLLKVAKFITDEIFDAAPSKDIAALYRIRHYEYIDLNNVWDNDKIGIISFMNKNPEYMKIWVSKIISAQYDYANQMLGKGIQPKILNIYDDCQTFLTNESTDTNPANRTVLNTQRMGRSYGFNNIFIVQDIIDFHKGIFNACSDVFIGYIRDFGHVRLLPEHTQKIEYNRKLFKEINMGNYMQKNVAYYHIPRNDNMAVTFFPSDPNCGGY